MDIGQLMAQLSKNYFFVIQKKVYLNENLKSAQLQILQLHHVAKLQPKRRSLTDKELLQVRKTNFPFREFINTSLRSVQKTKNFSIEVSVKLLF